MVTGVPHTDPPDHDWLSSRSGSVSGTTHRGPRRESAQGRGSSLHALPSRPFRTSGYQGHNPGLETRVHRTHGSPEGRDPCPVGRDWCPSPVSVWSVTSRTLYGNCVCPVRSASASLLGGPVSVKSTRSTRLGPGVPDSVPGRTHVETEVEVWDEVRSSGRSGVDLVPDARSDVYRVRVVECWSKLFRLPFAHKPSAYTITKPTPTEGTNTRVL